MEGEGSIFVERRQGGKEGGTRGARNLLLEADRLAASARQAGRLRTYTHWLELGRPGKRLYSNDRYRGRDCIIFQHNLSVILGNVSGSGKLCYFVLPPTSV